MLSSTITMSVSNHLNTSPDAVPVLNRLLPLLLSLVLVQTLNLSSSYAKHKVVKTPDLRILMVDLTPLPYSPSAGSLQLAVEVELPAELNESTMLEVSTLITSASRHSLRFLASRQAIESPPQSGQASMDGKPHVLVKLTWDGTDQALRRVESGRYSYEIRAKLLAVGENGPRTQMVSWPKRGTIDVK